MAKEVINQFKLIAPGGTATPAPPIGPALGQYGVNPGQFITQFNAATQDKKGEQVAVLITTYKDRSFTFEIKSGPASGLIMKAAKIKAGSGTAGKSTAGSVTMDQCREIAKEKLEDLNAFDLDAAARQIAGTARSMGVEVTGD
ncbi:MAG: 50S ribosomal protein L11 [Planctomycetota bacterium]